MANLGYPAKRFGYSFAVLDHQIGSKHRRHTGPVTKSGSKHPSFGNFPGASPSLSAQCAVLPCMDLGLA